MTDSILDSIKSTLNLSEGDDGFDQDLVLFINSVFSTLTQIGVGPPEGFMIGDSSATWTSFLGSDNLLNSVKSYMYIKVRLIFDPPQNSFTLTALKEMATEFEWRLNITREGETWVPPTPPTTC